MSLRPEQLIAASRRGSQRGIVAELLVAAKLTSEGYHVSFSPCNAAHDLIADDGHGKVRRLQVKCAYARESIGKMVVNLSSNTATGRKHYKSDQFDAFAIVVADDTEADVFYWPNTGEEASQKVISDELRTCTSLP